MRMRVFLKFDPHLVSKTLVYNPVLCYMIALQWGVSWKHVDASFVLDLDWFQLCALFFLFFLEFSTLLPAWQFAWIIYWNTPCIWLVRRLMSFLSNGFRNSQKRLTLILLLFLIRYGHMIDNVVLIVTGTLHERDVQELLEKCHPLGMFDRFCFAALYFLDFQSFMELSWFLFIIALSIATLAVAQNMRELYRLVLVDTPLAPYFSECITSEVYSHFTCLTGF